MVVVPGDGEEKHDLGRFFTSSTAPHHSEGMKNAKEVQRKGGQKHELPRQERHNCRRSFEGNSKVW
jgi:hypothetical protein